MNPGSPTSRLTAIVMVAVSIGLLAAASTARTAVPSPRADIGVSAAESADPVLLASSYTYRVSVSNGGPQQATRATLVATVAGPAELAGRASASRGTCRVEGVQVRCALGRLARRARPTILITVRPTALGTASVGITVSSATKDQNRRNNRAAISTRVVDFSSVRGRGIRSTAGDAGRPTVTTEVDARIDPTTRTVTGSFAVQYDPISSSPARGSDLRGRVVCLSVEGNKAMVGGVVESSNNPAYPAGTAVRLAFTDNGEPGAGRDTQVGFLGGDITPTCALEAVPELPLIEGDFVVRDGEP